ncbi:MAG: DPP IV N-terminal domain-containing protein, partial [Bacteroidales bacterium]|nr:DPP IV N-terminal domain-containing protein [Bacteroidales bacterium]
MRRVNDNCLYLRNRDHVFVFYSDNSETQIYCSLDKKATNFDLSTASGLTAFTRDNNLFFLRDGMRYSITKDLDTGIVNGQSVHRDEFGITKGTFWSNDGTRLAYYRMDESM